MNGWVNELQRQYPLAVYRAEQRRNGYLLETNRGRLQLRFLTGGDVKRAGFVENVQETFLQAGLVLPMIPNNEGGTISEAGSRHFYLTPWIQPAGWLDFGRLGAGLAKFHLLSCDCRLEPLLFSGGNRALGRWPNLWKRRVERLERFRHAAEKKADAGEEGAFDSFFTENYAYFLKLGRLATAYLYDSNYRHVCRNGRSLCKISHFHFGYDQFEMNLQQEPVFTDPFSWLVDMRVRDIGQFIKTEVRQNGWNPQTVYSFLKGYHDVSPLMPEEFTVMYAMFLLPGRMYKKMEIRYYQPTLFSGAGDDTLLQGEIADWDAVTAYDEMVKNEVLLREFPRFAENAFGVVIPTVLQ